MSYLQESAGPDLVGADLGAGSLSIVVPIYKEAANLPHLIPAIAECMAAAKLTYEVILVDDNSRDGTEELVASMVDKYPVRLLVRMQERGLSTAVIHGCRRARGEFLVCMDADLSHPPERIAALVEQVRDGGAEFAIGSRYVQGGRMDDNWGLFRWLNSRVATGLARPLTRAKDPMSGFFCLRRQTFQGAPALSPVGYKIGLELLVKCRCRNVKEIPIHFRDRQYGQSKLSLREQWNYVKHVKRLMDFKYGVLSKFLQFCFVGGTGMVVDLAIFNLLLVAAVGLPIARACAIGVAMTWNFWVNRRLTFSESRLPNWLVQYLTFVAACSVGAVVNWATSMTLVRMGGVWESHPTLAAIAGILAGTIFNFLASLLGVFRKPRRRA